jgi:hypothetical protein
MGRKRITKLLEQLEENQQKDLQNAAAIFTVAQVAVNGLKAQATESTVPPMLALPPSPAGLDKAGLLRRYGSYNNCRKAAKDQGIRFSRSPSWEQLIAAFNYTESLKQLIQAYVAQYPSPELKGTFFELRLG